MEARVVMLTMSGALSRSAFSDMISNLQTRESTGVINYSVIGLSALVLVLTCFLHGCNVRPNSLPRLARRWPTL